MKYDYLIVGAGLFGCTFAHLATRHGKKCLVIDRRPHLGGNLHCRGEKSIIVHEYGPHIFHTDSEEVYKFVTSLVKVNPFINTPMANYNGRMYNLPFNMNTFCQIFGVSTPHEAMVCIADQSRDIKEIRNLEDKAISLVGRNIYNLLVKGYTEKQWGRPCSELPASIITRLPLRFTFDNRYFQDRYQFIPVRGYNTLIERLLEGSVAIEGCDFFNIKDGKDWRNLADRLVFTGRIDQFYNFRFGELEYRSLFFEDEIVNTDNYQGVAVVNYTQADVPYTRIVEHRHFEQPKREPGMTVITKEYPAPISLTGEPYYPVNDVKNNAIYQQYKALAENDKDIIFGGRLAEYRYYDMDDVIIRAMELWKSELNR